jgi:glycerol-3-phosphate dehydrogenase (NAD(P)+)
MQVAVLGAGSWGAALALLLTKTGHSVRQWSNEPDVLQDLQRNQENSKYLPGHLFSDEFYAAETIGEAVDGAEAIMLVVPSNAVREVSTSLAEVMGSNPLIINAGKGLESSTGLRLSQVLAETLPEDIAHGVVVLSGPNFAAEIARLVPTATVVASADQERAIQAQAMLSSSILRVYRSSDVAGVEICGALKNVLAIGSGICEGLGYGDNTRAAFVTRGLVELMRLGTALGAEQKTFMGLAGVGDVMLTCSGHLSRNLRVGIAIGQGKTPEQALVEVKQTAEGVPTTKAAYNLATSLGIYAPITEQLHAILYEGKSPKQAVLDLMLREPKEE